MLRRPLLILALLTLAGGALPPVSQAAADPYRSAACRAMLWLRGQQLPDGSFGLRLPDGTAYPSASVTADAVYVLALLGQQPGGPAWTRGGVSAVDALAARVPSYVYSDAGQAGKVARAAALAGRNPRAFGGLDLLATIQAAYDPATGRYHPDFAYRHTLAVEGLLRAGVPVPAAALNAILAAQLPDGGWFWGFDGATSDVDSTGRVLMLLAGLAGVSAPASYNRAADYLAAAQAAEGGWGVGYPPGAPNANSTALTVGGLAAAGFDPQAARFHKNGRGALETLLSFQEASGAFVYIREAGREEVRLMATLDALTALAPSLGPGPLCQAVYLPMVLR